MMSDALSTFTRKVYATMAGALALSGLTAYLVSASPSLMGLLYQTPVMITLLVIEIIVALALTWAWKKLSPTASLIGLGLYALINGVTLSSIFQVYELGSIISVFAAATFFFFLLAIIGRTTSLDVSKISTICFVGLIAIMIVSIINIFLGSSLLSLILNVAGVIVFLGLTIYDHRRILELANSSRSDLDHLVVPMALQIYLDFVNIFLRLLELFGKRKD